MQSNQEQTYDKIEFSTWKCIFDILKPYHKLFLFDMALLIVIATIDVVFPLLNSYAIDNFVGKNSLEGIEIYALVQLCVITIQALVIFLHIRTSGRIEANACYLLRKEAFDKLQKLSFSFYDHNAVGWLLSRLGVDAQRIADIMGWAIMDLVWGAVIMLLSCIVMFVLNWKLALLIIVVMPPLAVVSSFFQKRILKNHREVRRINSLITSAYNEGIQGAKTTKTLLREEANSREFADTTAQMRQAAVKAASLSSMYMPIAMSIASVASGFILWRAGMDVFSGVLSFGVMSVFINYSINIFEPVRDMARVFAELQGAQAAAERVVSLIQQEEEIVDSPEVLEKYGDIEHPRRENWPEMQGEIRFENVSFQYVDGENVLEDFSLHVKPGETIALVGETGSGKSTIVNLLCRFYEPSSGRIYIDGHDYKEYSQLWLQSNLGYVLQAPHLFSGTVMENIRYGRLDATDEEVHAAAKQVNADGFIAKLQDGYNTQVGEGGNRLSTGEKQLISFARALLANPRLLVLDEATSSIDTKTEAIIQSSIATMLEGRTSFIIAHRLSTIRGADRILVIEDGHVIEQGSHKELIAQRGHYHSLYTQQYSEERTLEILSGV